MASNDEFGVQMYVKVPNQSDHFAEQSPSGGEAMQFTTGRIQSLGVTKRHPDDGAPQSDTSSALGQVKAVAVNLENKSPRSLYRSDVLSQKCSYAIPQAGRSSVLRVTNL